MARAFSALAALAALSAALRPTALVLLPWAAALVFLAACHAHHEHLPWLSAESAAAVAAVLMLARWRPQRLAWQLGGRVAVAVAFATHGVVALRGEPRFLDLIIGAGASELAARAALPIIGWLDLVVAAACLLPRVAPAALLWCAGWGFLTAISRPWSGYHPLFEMLLRAANGGLPLVLLMAHAARTRPTATAEPERRLAGAAAD